MFKNTGSQKVWVYAYDVTTGLPKTGDAANISAYLSKDFGAVTQLTDTSATEADATNAKGYYLFDISQTETNADCLMVSGKSSTSNIVVLGAPAVIFTVPSAFGIAGGTSGGVLIVGTNTGTVTISDGLLVNRSSSNSSAVVFTGNGNGDGCQMVGGSNAHGLTLTANGSTKHGLNATGASGNGSGASFVGGGNGDGITASGAGLKHGINATGGATGHGILSTGGATSGDGFNCVATTSGHGVTFTGVGTTKHGINATGGATSSHGISASGGGTGAGLKTTGGATGNGVQIVGGGTSGDALSITTTAGHGINIAPAGTGKHGIFATGASLGTSHGVFFQAGAAGGNGLYAYALTGDGAKFQSDKDGGSGMNCTAIAGAATGYGIQASGKTYDIFMGQTSLLAGDLYGRVLGGTATAFLGTGVKADLIDAPNATAITAIQSGLATAATQTTILNRIGAFTGSGLNTILGFFRGLMRSDAALTPSDAGGTFDNTTDSLQAIRDRGDAAWIGGGGGGGTVVVNPVFAALAAGEANKAALVAYKGAVPGPYQFPAYGSSLAGKTLELIVFDHSNGDEIKFTIGGSGAGTCTAGGAGTDEITATGTYAQTTETGNFSFIVWNSTDRKVLFAGSFAVRPTPGP